MKIKLAVILTIITMLFLNQNLFAQGMQERMHDKDKFRMQIHDRLNLSDSQKEQIETLRLNHQNEIIDLKANVERKKLEMRELKLKGNYSREEYLKKFNEVLSAQNQLRLSRENHKMDVYQLLDDNQKKEWNRMTNNFEEHRKHRMIKKMRFFEED